MTASRPPSFLPLWHLRFAKTVCQAVLLAAFRALAPDVGRAIGTGVVGVAANFRGVFKANRRIDDNFLWPFFRQSEFTGFRVGLFLRQRRLCR